MTNDNSEKLRKWLGTLVPIAILMGSVIVWGQNLSAGIDAVSSALAQHIETDRVREASQEADLADLKEGGSDLSHINEKKIIKIETNGEYTKKAVTRIEVLVKEISEKIK